MDQSEKLHENVYAAIRGLEAECKIYDHRELATEIRTPADFAAALGYPPERIAKTLFLCSPDRQAYAAAVCSVSRRLDFKSAAGAIGVSRVEVASAEDLSVKTSYPRNGVSPLGLADGISIVVDRALLDYPSILIGGGATAVVRDSARAVAYIVPAQPGADLDLAGLRDFLADHLPRFMIPAGIVILPELPKTINGKLDTAALPEWSPGRPVAGDALAADRHDEDTARVIEIVARVTGFAGPVSPSDDFINDLGGTSLGVVQVLAELERQCGRRLRLNEALADTSVAGLAALLREAATASPADFAFNTDGDAPPLFLVQAYLGSMLGLRRLAELLPPEQPAYGLYAPGDGLLGYRPASDQREVFELAEDVLSRVRAIAPSGPVVLAGHSAGGLVVLEAARKMLEAGQAEPRVLLLDTTRPFGALGYYWGESVMLWRQLPRIAVERLLAAASKPFRRPPPLAAPAGTGPAGTGPDAVDPADVAPVNAETVESASAHESYRVAPYDGKVAVMRTRQGWLIAMGHRTLGWSSVTRGTPYIIPVPGTHVSVLRPPHVQVVARRLAEWLSAGRPSSGCAPVPAAPDGAEDRAPAHRS